MKIKDYRDAQLHYTKDDRGDATGAFEMFVAEEPSSMDQEPRRTGFKSGGSYDYGSMQHKINSVNAAYKRYLNMRKGKQKYKVIPFEIFSEEFAKENFADGGSAGQLVQPNAQSERIGFKDGTPVKFDESRVKIPTGKFVGEGRDKSQIFKIKNTKTGTVRYITTGAGGGVKKAYKSIKELKDAKLESLPDEFFVQSETPYKNGIKEITSKNRKTGETKVFYKPRVGPDKATLPGKGAETKKEAQKFIDNYFKENPKQVRVRDPEKDYASKDVRKKALKETDLTKAEGTPRFNYHHVRQIAGGVPLTTDDVMIINQRINSSLGTKYNKPLNAISAAIQKNNRLALEAMNNKQEGLALDYMKRVDELNTSAEKIVNSAIDKLPEKYKGYVGFNQFTLPTNEYGLPISNEPMIIKKVGGMPVSKDAVDLTTLNLEQEAEFRKIVREQAEAGKTGPIKLTSKKANLLSQFCNRKKLQSAGSVQGLTCSMEEIQTNMKKQINEAAKVSKDGKIPKKFGKLRGFAKMFFGDIAIPLEYMFMAPDLAAGDVEGALRSSTAGLFGAGKVDLEKLPPGEGKKYIKHVNALTNFLNNYQSKLMAENRLEKLEIGDEGQTESTDKLAQAEKNMADIIKNYQSFGYTYAPGEKGLLEGKVEAQKLIRDKVTSDFDKKIDKGASTEFFKDSNKELLKENLRSLGGDPYKVTPINNLEDYIKNKGEATAGNTNILFNRLPYTLEQAEAYGVPQIFDTYAGGYAGVETPGSMEDGQVDMGTKDVRDAYSSLPINMASQLAALEKKEFEEGMLKRRLEQELFAGGGIAGLSGGDKSGRPPESGPASQGLRSLYKNGRKL